jgi:hypothetical protein
VWAGNVTSAWLGVSKVRPLNILTKAAEAAKPTEIAQIQVEKRESSNSEGATELCIKCECKDIFAGAFDE